MNLFTKLTAVAAISASIGLAVPSISHAAVGSQELSKGMHNKDVAQLQDVLHHRGYLSQSDSKGYYDEQTAEAVKAYQEHHHLNADGIAGPNTFKTMDLKNTIGPELLSQGDHGYDVTVLQNKLKDLGFYNGTVDGKLGTQTDKAIRAFQTSQKDLLVDGIAGPNTKAALKLKVVGNETAAQKENKADYNNHKTVTAQKSTSAQTTSDNQQSSQKSSASSSMKGSTITVTSTAYTANCAGCTGKTATGQDLKANPNQKVIAVDPNVIPLGSKVYVPGYGVAIAGDTGGAIKGKRIDVFLPSTSQADSWGVKTINVTILK